MRKYFKLPIISLALIVLVFSSCEELEMAEPISTEDYPVATFTTDFTGTEVTEGDTITYTIIMDKMMDTDVKFSVDLDASSTANAMDYIAEDVTIAAYSTEAVMQIIIVSDNYPEVTENLKIEVGCFVLGQRYTLNPTTENGMQDLSIINVNYPGALTVGVLWADDHDDWDAYLIDEAGAGAVYGETTYDWTGYAGATGADPEIMIYMDGALPWTMPDGVYYVDVDPWAVAANVTDFEISVGHADQSVDVYNFTFDNAKTADYPMTWGFSAVKIVRAGDTFTSSLVPAFE